MLHEQLSDGTILIRRMGRDQEERPGTATAELTPLQGENAASFDVHLDERRGGPRRRALEELVEGDAVDDEP